MDLRQPCPCSSGKSYDECCSPFHRGDLPKNALELMRSRYAAYVLNLPDYIIKTTHPANSECSENLVAWKKSLSSFSQETSFRKLDILDFKENGSMATVVFTASLLQQGQDATFTEKSYFEKRGGRWLYRSGKLVSGHVPSVVTTAQLRVLPLAYYGESVLRQKASKVAHITEDIKKLVEAMADTMDASEGVGLAAPQIHHSLRLFIVRVPKDRSDDGKRVGELQVFINPKLSSPSLETWAAQEGCLSIPGIRRPVLRPKEITVEYTSLQGEVITDRFSGWEARIIMHENDHINGVLFIDRLSAKEKAEIDPFLKNLEKRMQDHLSL